MYKKVSCTFNIVTCTNFRSDILEYVLYRMGLLAVLRSKVKRGEKHSVIHDTKVSSLFTLFFL